MHRAGTTSHDISAHAIMTLVTHYLDVIIAKINYFEAVNNAAKSITLKYKIFSSKFSRRSDAKLVTSDVVRALKNMTSDEASIDLKNSDIKFMCYVNSEK